MLNAVDKGLLETVADLYKIPSGAFSLRKNGSGLFINSSENVTVKAKEGQPGIDVIVKPGTKNESIHIPVIISQSGIKDMVYNTIEIGEGADVVLVAGCGIHNSGSEASQHDGVHNIIIKKGARLRYIEKHYGEGNGSGGKILNPQTVVEIHEGGIGEFEMVQIGGVDSTHRVTEAKLGKRAKLVIKERLMTHGEQEAFSDIKIELNGEEALADVISRSVAKHTSSQVFRAQVIARSAGRGHVECDSIIMDSAKISSIPEIRAEHPEAELTHEAAIGKISGEQIIKLMSLGLSEEEAVKVVIEGFLR
ncbi:MAG: hypothetical protein PWQ82_1046 [Thermosediminibacterales bacterium]|nr:hypothetical protein [Thermosediminibacterales bacterium]MDK2836710.1 hypothetical protein [Thermosediminibacterales bacterium]